MSWLFKAIVLGLSLLTLSKTESEITCPEGSEVEGKYGHLWYGRLTLHVARRIAVWAEGGGGGLWWVVWLRETMWRRRSRVLWRTGVASPAHVGRSTYFSPRTYVRKVSEGVSEHSADNLPFLKGTSDFLTENKCIHTYYLRTLQRRLGVDVPLRNGKLRAECSEPPSLTLRRF